MSPEEFILGFIIVYAMFLEENNDVESDSVNTFIISKKDE